MANWLETFLPPQNRIWLDKTQDVPHHRTGPGQTGPSQDVTAIQPWTDGETPLKTFEFFRFKIVS